MSTEDRRAERAHPRRSVLRDLGAEIAEDRVLGLAAEIAFFTVLSLLPGLLVAAGLLLPTPSLNSSQSF